MIVVTGANGLLGSFIVRRLLAEKLPFAAVVRKGSSRSLLADAADSITWREADVLDFAALTAAFENASTVIHAAAMVSFNPRRARKIFEANVEGTRNVVDVCLGMKIPAIVHISSVALGRQKGMTAADENTKWTDSDLNSHYAESKYLAELELYRGKEEGLRVSMVNPSVILAPADWSRSSAQIFQYIWNERPWYTDGALNCVDVRDVTDIVMALLQNEHNGHRFIANGASVPFTEIFGKIAGRFGKRAPFIRVRDGLTGLAGWFEEMRSLITGSEPVVTRQSAKLARESFVYSNEKAKRELGITFRPLDETLDWCCSEYLRKINTNNQK